MIILEALILCIFCEVVVSWCLHAMYVYFRDRAEQQLLHLQEDGAGTGHRPEDPDPPIMHESWMLGVFKGSLERFTIAFCLIHGYPHILTFFAAIKLGTRLSTMTDFKAMNDYILIGNLVSVLVAVIYAVVYPLLDGEILSAVSRFLARGY